MNSDELESFKLQLNNFEFEIQELKKILLSEVNQRTLTIEWLNRSIDYKMDSLINLSNYLVREQVLNDQEFRKKLSLIQPYFSVITRNIAIQSNDYLEPESTLEGIVSKPEFVRACERILEKSHIKFLDVGCGAGGLVIDFLKKGHFALGLDGSDFNKIIDNGYWNYIEHLHTCDITEPFKFLDKEKKIINFDIITMWEVFEHIPQNLIDNVLRNIHYNIDRDGYFIGSISTIPYQNDKTGTVYHVTLENKQWWSDRFFKNGFQFIESPLFDFEYCRGVGNKFQDPHSYFNNPEFGFQFVAKKI